MNEGELEVSDRPIIRCYECPNYIGGSFKGRCKELKQRVDAVDWCYRDQVKALKEGDLK